MANDAFEFGPKMRVLAEKQRAFVMATVEFPALSGAAAARLAGYSDVGDGCKVRACELLQDQRIVEAIQEQAGKRLWAISLKAASRVEKLIDSDDEAIALKAAGMVLDRVNLAPQQNINLNHNVTDQSGRAIMERIALLATKFGLDSRQLLDKPAPVDAEFSEVKDG